MSSTGGKSIWNDDDWTVEEEYLSSTSINTIKSSPTSENVLVTNKGDTIKWGMTPANTSLPVNDNFRKEANKHMQSTRKKDSKDDNFLGRRSSLIQLFIMKRKMVIQNTQREQKVLNSRRSMTHIKQISSRDLMQQLHDKLHNKIL